MGRLGRQAGHKTARTHTPGTAVSLTAGGLILAAIANGEELFTMLRASVDFLSYSATKMPLGAAWFGAALGPRGRKRLSRPEPPKVHANKWRSRRESNPVLRTDNPES